MGNFKRSENFYDYRAFVGLLKYLKRNLLCFVGREFCDNDGNPVQETVYELTTFLDDLAKDYPGIAAKSPWVLNILSGVPVLTEKMLNRIVLSLANSVISAKHATVNNKTCSLRELYVCKASLDRDASADGHISVKLTCLPYLGDFAGKIFTWSLPTEIVGHILLSSGYKRESRKMFMNYADIAGLYLGQLKEHTKAFSHPKWHLSKFARSKNFKIVRYRLAKRLGDYKVLSNMKPDFLTDFLETLILEEQDVSVH